MPMPPKVPPSELFLALAKRPRPETTVEFPTKVGTVGRTKMWILSEEELHTARANARNEVVLRLGPDAKPGEMAYEEMYRDEVLVQMLVLACRAVENTMVPSFPSAAMARKYLTTDELAVLAQAYALFRVESGPMIAEMSKAEMDAWLKALKEGASFLPLSRLTLDAAVALLRHSVQSQENSSTGSGWSGPPADNSPTSTSDEEQSPDDLSV